MYTSDSRLRSYLITELKSDTDAQFSQLEEQAIGMMAMLDKLYPCESFDTAVTLGKG